MKKKFIQIGFLLMILTLIIVVFDVQAQSPGGVSSNLELWLKADAGVEEASADPAEPGDNILNWLDQSGNTNDFTNDFGSAPLYSIVSGYNVIDFSQLASDYLRGPSVFSGTGARTMIIIGQPTSLSSSGASNCIFQLAPNESGGRGYSLFLEAPGTSTGLACRVSGNRIMDHTSSTTLPSFFVVQNGASENVTSTDFFVNGTQITTEITSGANTLNTSSLGTIVGGFSSGADNNPENTYDFNGYVFEIIVYSQELSNADRNSIESYLNIRYGVTIPVSSHNFYNQTSFPQDIAGIGQDNITQGFSKDSAWSLNPSSVLTIYNPNSLDDGDYLVWGHDGGGSNAYSFTGIPASVSYRTERIWRVNEIGETGTQTLRFYLPGLNQCGSPIAASDLKLLIDNVDTDFSDATSIDGSIYSNDTLYFTGVNLSDDDHFTIGITGLERPGDVGSNLVLWLKADCGVEEAVSDTAELGDGVLNWLDQSGNGSDVTNSSGSAPVFNQIGGNFAIDFSGGSSYLTGPSVLSGTTARTFILVGQPSSISNSSTNCVAALAPNNTTGTGYGLFFEQPGASGVNGLALRVSGNKVMDYSVSTSSPSIIQTSSAASANVTATEFYANGQLLTELESQSAAALNTSNAGVLIGGFSTGGDLIFESGFDYNGYVYEIIAFDREITCEERKQLDIYLADKYGIELDYYNETSSGSNGIDGNVNGIIKQFGIYPDITTYAGGGLSVTDVSYLSDAGDALFTGNDGAFGVSNSDVPGGIDRRLNRIWFADYTSCNSNTGDITLSFDLSSLPCDGFDVPANAANYRLLSSSSTTFSGATAFSGASIVGNSIEFTLDVSNINDQFFTIASTDYNNSTLWWPISGPADITSGLQLWLRTDCGVEEDFGDDAEVGDPVAYWRDQSGNGNDMENSIGSAPTLATISGSNAIDFSGGSNYLSGSPVITGTTGRTLIVALNINALAIGNGNAALSLSQNATAGTGYALTFETPGSNNGMSVRVSGNKIMDYAPPIGQPIIVSVQSDDNENVSDTEFFVDGESVIELESVSPAALNTNSVGVILGGWSTSGDLNPTATWDFDGAIYEVIVYDRELSCDEREDIEAYLSNKYSSTLYYEVSESIGDNGIGTDPDTLYLGNTNGTSSAMSLSDVSTITDCIDSVFFAHDNASGRTEQGEDADMSGLVGTDVERWTRKWYAIALSNESDPGTVSITFDMDLYPASSGITVAGAQYRIIDRTAGAWSVTPRVSGPIINVGQNTVSFEVDIDDLNQKEFTLATLDNGVSPLPLELFEFDAKLINGIVELTWIVNNQEDIKSFSLEKSKDANNWIEFLAVDPKIEPIKIFRYDEIDLNPYEGITYYRLKVHYSEGQFKYSSIRTIRYEAYELISELYPNPAKDNLIIKSASKMDQMYFSIYNSLGELINEFELENSESENYDLDLNGYREGLYILQIGDGVKMEKHKFIINR